MIEKALTLQVQNAANERIIFQRAGNTKRRVNILLRFVKPSHQRQRRAVIGLNLCRVRSLLLQVLDVLDCVLLSTQRSAIAALQFEEPRHAVGS